VDQLAEIVTIIAFSLGTAWASGINLYAAILALGLFASTGYLTLPEGLQVLADPVVIAAAGFMYLVEFFADKVPGVDSAWDAIHTFIRIPAGALLAAAAFGDVDPAVSLAAALVGGGLAAATHVTKASTRLLVNTSPEPFSNVGVSLSEDVATVSVLWLALFHPWLFVVFLFFFLLFLVWFLPVLWRGLRSIVASIHRLIGGGDRSLPVE
jgi:hypothetical protein